MDLIDQFKVDLLKMSSAGDKMWSIESDCVELFNRMGSNDKSFIFAGKRGFL